MQVIAENTPKKKKKNSGFDRIHLYASQTLVGPCYRLSEKATFGGRALFRGDFYGHKKKSSWSTSVAPTACLHFDINIWEIWHVLCRKRTNRNVCTGIFCRPKLLNYGLSKLETVRNLSYCLTDCLLSLITGIDLWIFKGIPVNKWLSFCFPVLHLCGSVNCVITSYNHI